MSDKKPNLIVIIGPTASGKSALAIEIAKKVGGEIVSADSRQIYREMSVGTAKPKRDKNPKSEARNPKQIQKTKIQNSKLYYSQNIPHHLIDIKNPDEDYSVAEYKKDAITAIDDIIARGKMPILVGGTGLYISAIVDNWDIPEIKADPKLRAKLEKEIANSPAGEGLKSLFQKLIATDPESAYIVDPKNPRRVIRALEIALLSGKKFSEQRKKGEPLYDAVIIGLTVFDEILKKRIAKRIREMADEGLVNEVKKLIKKYGADCKAFDAIGYREIIGYLKKEKTLEEALAEIDTNTIKYAKRQMTWFRKYFPQTKWI